MTRAQQLVSITLLVVGTLIIIHSSFITSVAAQATTQPCSTYDDQASACQTNGCTYCATDAKSSGFKCVSGGQAACPACKGSWATKASCEANLDPTNTGMSCSWCPEGSGCCGPKSMTCTSLYCSGGSSGSDSSSSGGDGGNCQPHCTIYGVIGFLVIVAIIAYCMRSRLAGMCGSKNSASNVATGAAAGASWYSRLAADASNLENGAEAIVNQAEQVEGDVQAGNFNAAAQDASNLAKTTKQQAATVQKTANDVAGAAKAAGVQSKALDRTVAQVNNAAGKVGKAAGTVQRGVAAGEKAEAAVHRVEGRT